MRFPRTHLVLLAVISLGLASFVVAKFSEDDTHDRFTTESVLEEIPVAVEDTKKLQKNKCHVGRMKFQVPKVSEITEVGQN